MPDERESPSAGWREVYREMDAATDAEEATLPCPDCGRTCSNALRDVYECAEHGVFRPSASDGGESSDGSEDSTDDAKNRIRGTAD